MSGFLPPWMNTVLPYHCPHKFLSLSCRTKGTYLSITTSVPLKDIERKVR